MRQEREFVWFSEPRPFEMVPNAADIELVWLRDLLARQDELEAILGLPIGLTLGCGYYGCVMQSSGPWVIKITSDPTEGKVWQLIKNLAARSPAEMFGFPRVQRVLRVLPDISSFLLSRPRHIIVREAADPVFKARKVTSERTLRELGFSRRAIARMQYDFLGFAYEAKERLMEEGLADDLAGLGVPKAARAKVEANLWGMVKMLDMLTSYRRFAQEVHREWYVRRGHVRRETRLMVTRTVPLIVEEATEWWGSRPVANSFALLAEGGDVLADAHFLNIGWRVQAEIAGFAQAPRCIMVFDPGVAPLEDPEFIEVEEVELAEAP